MSATPLPLTLPLLIAEFSPLLFTPLRASATRYALPCFDADDIFESAWRATARAPCRLLSRCGADGAMLMVPLIMPPALRFC